MKDKLKVEEVVRMLKPAEVQAKILYNSRVAVNNSRYIPMMMGTVICSVVYFSTTVYLIDLIIGWAWLSLSVHQFVAYRKNNKKIMEMQA